MKPFFIEFGSITGYGPHEIGLLREGALVTPGCNQCSPAWIRDPGKLRQLRDGLTEWLDEHVCGEADHA